MPVQIFYPFSNCVLSSLLLGLEFLYILDTNPLLNILFKIFFFQSDACLFHFLGCLTSIKVFFLAWWTPIYQDCSFMDLVYGVMSKNSLPTPRLCILSKRFIFLYFIFRNDIFWDHFSVRCEIFFFSICLCDCSVTIGEKSVSLIKLILSKIYWPYLYRSISVFSVLFHWCMCLLPG